MSVALKWEQVRSEFIYVLNASHKLRVIHLSPVTIISYGLMNVQGFMKVEDVNCSIMITTFFITAILKSLVIREI